MKSYRRTVVVKILKQSNEDLKPDLTHDLTDLTTWSHPQRETWSSGRPEHKAFVPSATDYIPAVVMCKISHNDAIISYRFTLLYMGL